MNTMNMPGFNAEASCYRTRNYYSIIGASDHSGRLIPATIETGSAPWIVTPAFNKRKLCRWLLRQCTHGWDLGCDLSIYLC